ncbi:MAG: 50S ribosomal protein L6 [Bdellovibrionales bacterium]|nr:50S ribosomal protein L6 [Bdellovibrionales bacterium]
MSRIGNAPVSLPSGVKAEIAGQLLKVQGPKGSLERSIRPEIAVELQDGTLVFKRKDESKQTRAFHGMERALVRNMVVGVSEGFSKELALIGVGYRAEEKGANLVLHLGYSHPIEFQVPKGVKGILVKEQRDTFIRIEGIDRQLVGQVAAQIRSLRPPEPYKGKGVRYRDEEVRRKAGKAGKK